MLKYSVVWYTYDKENDMDKFHEKEYKTKKSAMNFYEKHKADKDKYLWWVSSRDEYWMVVDDFIV